MTRGRKRKPNPSIPPHIEQQALPRGIYWDQRFNGCWYVFETTSVGKRTRKNVASAAARLSDLHAIIEARRGTDTGSLASLLKKFHTSLEFKALATKTRDDYERQRRLATNYKTKAIGLLGSLQCTKLSTHFIQRIIDAIAQQGHPAKANHLSRYLSRVFSWGVRRGHCPENPCKGVAQAKERKQRRVPSVELMERVIAHARLAGSLQAHTMGSCPPYLWIVAELAYLLRLRGIEVLDLSDASAQSDGALVTRRKGSRGNITRWTPRLTAAWQAAVDYRKKVTLASLPIPIDPARRFLVVGQDGRRLSKSGLDSAWQRFMVSLVDSGVITADQRFGLHALKHRGITDTEGNRADKQEASGHKSAAMMDIYDHSVPVVDPSAKG